MVVVWLIRQYTVGIRVSAAAEIMDLDKAELDMEAYPECSKG